MTCDVCHKNEAIIFQPHSGRSLCKDCFFNDVKERVRKEAEKQGILNSRKVLLAVSGGKDSLVLVDAISSFISASRIVAFNIVEGIGGYNRAEQAEKLRKYMETLGVQLVSTSFKSEVGYTLDEMVRSSEVKGMNVSPCTFCGGFRRKLINNAGILYGTDLVATGHNLDDEVQTIMINLIRGDLSRLIRLGDVPIKVSGKFVTRVKPLRKIYEWETTMYAYLKGYSFQEVECPHIVNKPTLRAKVRDLIYSLEEERPGSLLKILEQFDEISQKIRSNASFTELPRCEICGDPTSYGRRICKNCELLIRSGLLSQEYQKYLPMS
ncbi:TIGR00269 family protein [Sulfuracidifex metallicus]|uniref:TIGR00269 family protein n=1 Tax=Sulfuracidifex metallicus DSM 6482 = JCM 9184 TaxID=523847 RepID=A0A6A9QHG2_SULME|nr:TIGR00269 family protein [Sulfuracidifex metallicus]MUN28134.1 TIGR00269 family protein [Sulfuracidifex metallicus DSM 6482 = JCM 9184]WOE51325.1 TIGR00269 family protein [Sulfuracidifex metallicus DSM 6482 = JCM 9184]